MKGVIATAVVALAIANTEATAANILINPGFETGSLPPWFASNGTPVVTNEEAHTGTFSVAAFGADEIQQNFAPVPTESINEVSFWVMREGGPFDQFTFHYGDGTEENHLVNAIGNDWIFFDVTDDLAAGKNLVGFSIFGTSSGPAFLDDFTIDVGIAQVPIGSTLALVAIGLGGLGFSRRKRA